MKATSVRVDTKANRVVKEAQIMNHSPTLPNCAQSLFRPSWLPETTWPFETFGIDVEGSSLAVTEAGRGPALLFVHVGTWSFIWRDLVTLLASDFRCIFFDAPGNGQSRQRSTAPASMDAASHAVKAVISALDLRDLTLVAHDLGGPPAFAAIAPIAQRIRCIVAMNTFGWRPSGAALRIMLAIMGSGIMREIDVLTGLVPRLTASSFGVGRHYDACSRNAFRAGMGPAGWRAFHDYMHDATRCEDLYRQAAQALTGPLAKVPLLTVFGERNDPFGFQKQWKKLFPDARQVVVDRGNHFPMCDAPEFVAHTIRSWLRECVAESSVLRRRNP
jgi:pimeloyl-ACP methyl ester carboxylesterase